MPVYRQESVKLPASGFLECRVAHLPFREIEQTSPQRIVSRGCRKRSTSPGSPPRGRSMFEIDDVTIRGRQQWAVD